MKKIIKEILDDHIKTISGLHEFSDKLQKITDEITAVIKNGGKIIICGNGGSAADAQHIATEFVVRLSSDYDRSSLPALALTTNTSLLTACANDYGFEEIFARQIKSLGQSGDFLIGLSTSGNSENVYKAIIAAKEQGLKTFLLSGKDGGKIKNIVDNSIIVSNYNTARIQEAHITLGHIICLLVESKYFKN